MTGYPFGSSVRTMNTLGDRIRAARLERGLKGTTLADAVGVRAHTVWRWEAGKVHPDADNVALIARALGVSTDWLLTGEEFCAPVESAAELQ